MLIPIDKETIKPVDYWVTKANALVEANYRLSLIQQKIVITLASLIQPDDEDFKWYRLNIKHFMEIFGRNDHGIYVEMVAAVHNLMEKVVTIYLGGEKYLKTHWVQSAEYEVGGGYVDVSFDPKLKPFFLHLKDKFTTYKLENVMRLRSIYSIRIYELLKQYQGVGKRSITVESLRKMLGIEPKEYDRYNDFKRYVLQVAHKEINEKTDISFDYREIKLSRKINELEFTITKKAAPDKPRKTTAPAFVEDKAAARLKKKIDAYIEKLSPDDLERLTIEATDKARQEGGAAYRDRKIPDHVVRGYMLELAKARMKK
jgi:plasmid replication initiation protein